MHSHRFICIERFSVVERCPGSAMVGFKPAQWFAGVSSAFFEIYQTCWLFFSPLLELLVEGWIFVDDWFSFRTQCALGKFIDARFVGGLACCVRVFCCSCLGYERPFASQAYLYYCLSSPWRLQVLSARGSILEDFVPLTIADMSVSNWFAIRSSSDQLSIGCYRVWMALPCSTLAFC